MNNIELAKWLHDNYEEVAKQKDWNTQENCKVEFDTLPDANKQTMIEIAQRLLDFQLLRLHFVSKTKKMSKKKLISKLSLSEEQIEEIKKKHSIDVVEELENILMEELKKIGATTDSPAFKNARKLIKGDNQNKL